MLQAVRFPFQVRGTTTLDLQGLRCSAIGKIYAYVANRKQFWSIVDSANNSQSGHFRIHIALAHEPKAKLIALVGPKGERHVSLQICGY